MRVVHFDVDSLRPDHLGCYGYYRNTSPVVDQLATEGVRATNVYASDAPCLPSRTAFWSGRFGLQTGVSDHVGASADPHPDGADRQWHSTLAETCLMTQLRRAGLRTVTISPFAERHSAFHWYAGYSEVHNLGDTGHGGVEMAEDASSTALEWLSRRGTEDNWYLHVNFWDVHWPYRTPANFGEPFAEQPAPQWLTQELLNQHNELHGAKSARDFSYRTRDLWERQFPRQPVEMKNLADARKMFDGYDTAVRYVDTHIGAIVEKLQSLCIYDDTTIIVTADHGEHLGELNMYMSHRIADRIVCHLPFIIKGPGLARNQVDEQFHYHLDAAAALVEYAGGTVPQNWDGRSCLHSWKNDTPADGTDSTNRRVAVEGREYLVVSAGVGGLTRGVRFDRYLCTRVYHDGFSNLPDYLLFDVESDPAQLHNLADGRPDLVARAMVYLDHWKTEAGRRAPHPIDPLWRTALEGGPQDMRGRREEYCLRLEQTGRAHAATALRARYCEEG